MELGPVMMEKERNAPLDPAVARGYFRDILAGVHYLHFQGVIHRCVLLAARDVTCDSAPRDLTSRTGIQGCRCASSNSFA
jgi:hypothetical protein